MRRALVLLVVLAASGCGYSWQSKSNPWRAQGIERLFIRTLTNNTLHSGVEVPFTSALIREFARDQRIQLVNDEKDADAFIEGSVDSVASQMSAETSLGAISKAPEAQSDDLKDIRVASEYTATASLTVKLIRKHDNRTLWEQAFAQPRIYQGNNRFGAQGVTSALINASEQQLAVGEIAQFVAADVHDAMFEAF